MYDVNNITYVCRSIFPSSHPCISSFRWRCRRNDRSDRCGRHTTLNNRIRSCLDYKRLCTRKTSASATVCVCRYQVALRRRPMAPATHLSCRSPERVPDRLTQMSSSELCWRWLSIREAASQFRHLIVS